MSTGSVIYALHLSVQIYYLANRINVYSRLYYCEIEYY